MQTATELLDELLRLPCFNNHSFPSIIKYGTVLLAVVKTTFQTSVTLKPQAINQAMLYFINMCERLKHTGNSRALWDRNFVSPQYVKGGPAITKSGKTCILTRLCSCDTTIQDTQTPNIYHPNLKYCDPKLPQTRLAGSFVLEGDGF